MFRLFKIIILVTITAFLLTSVYGATPTVTPTATVITTPTITVICIEFSEMKYSLVSNNVAMPIIPKEFDKYKQRVYIANSKDKEKIKKFTVCFWVGIKDVSDFTKIMDTLKLKAVVP